jgi:hypothetical protein
VPLPLSQPLVEIFLSLVIPASLCPFRVHRVQLWLANPLGNRSAAFGQSISAHDRGGSAPIEQVIDAHRPHLDVGIVRTKQTVLQKAIAQIKVVQPKVLVLKLYRPILREGPFDACARYPTTPERSGR